MIEFTWVDIIISIIFLLSTAIGIYRGILREIITILVWSLAFVLALVHGATAGELFTFIDNPAAQKVCGSVMIFVSVIIAGIIIKFFMFRSFNIGKPTGLGRLLGSGFGVLRGIAIVSFMLSYISASQVQEQLGFKNSQFAPYFEDIVSFLNVKLPPKWRHKNKNTGNNNAVNNSTDTTQDGLPDVTGDTTQTDPNTPPVDQNLAPVDTNYAPVESNVVPINPNQAADPNVNQQ